MSDIQFTFDVPKGKRPLTFCMIIITELCICSIYALSIFVGPLHDAYGWSNNSIVLAFTFMEIVSAPALILIGWLVNRFGIKKVQVTCGIIYGLAIIASGLATNVAGFVIAQGVIGGAMMVGVYMCNIAVINSLFPDRKGLVLGIMYGAQGIASIVLAPILAACLIAFSVRAVLVVQGIIFTALLLMATLLIYDPTRGNKELQARIQEEADRQEMEAAIAGKDVETLPTMRWKRALTHPAFWMTFLSVIAIQMIGNVLVTDIAVLAEDVYSVNRMDSAWVVSAFGVGAGLGGIVIGGISDKFGPYHTTFILGLIDGILLLAFALFAKDHFMMFGILCVIQGFTFNGMTTLNPIMITDSYNIKDLGTMLGILGISGTLLGIVGPQLGLEAPFVPMIILCAVLSFIGAILAKTASKSLNTYYQHEGSRCVVR